MQRYAFESGRIKVLLDPTREQIESELDSLLKEARSQTQVLVYVAAQLLGGICAYLLYTYFVNSSWPNGGDFDSKVLVAEAEVMCKPKSNSGIYFHTKFQPDGWPQQGFEAQVNNTHGDRKKTGGLYNVKDVMESGSASKKDDDEVGRRKIESVTGHGSE